MRKMGLTGLTLEPADPANRPAPASLIRRAAAFSIDLFLVGATTTIAGVRWGTETGPMRWQLNGLPACGMILFIPCYWLVPETIFGATPGKFFLDLRILSLRFGDLEFGQVLKRDLVKLVDFATFGFVSLMVALSNPLRQSLGDLWAGTMVVDATQYGKWKAGSSGQDFGAWLKSFDQVPKARGGDPQVAGPENPPPNTALQRTRVRPAGGRSPLSFETLGDMKVIHG